jgi:hypothetical protein
MKTRRSRLVRWSAIVGLTFPLLATGSCLTIAQQSVIEGAFDAITPLIVARLREELGLPPLTDDSTSGWQSGGSSTPYDSQPGV